MKSMNPDFVDGLKTNLRGIQIFKMYIKPAVHVNYTILFYYKFIFRQNIDSSKS
jgi:hypothetical protein